MQIAYVLTWHWDGIGHMPYHSGCVSVCVSPEIPLQSPDACPSTASWLVPGTHDNE